MRRVRGTCRLDKAGWSDRLFLDLVAEACRETGLVPRVGGLVPLAVCCVGVLSAAELSVTMSVGTAAAFSLCELVWDLARLACLWEACVSGLLSSRYSVSASGVWEAGDCERECEGLSGDTDCLLLVGLIRAEPDQSRVEESGRAESDNLLLADLRFSDTFKKLSAVRGGRSRRLLLSVAAGGRIQCALLSSEAGRAGGVLLSSALVRGRTRSVLLSLAWSGRIKGVYLLEESGRVESDSLLLADLGFSDTFKKLSAVRGGRSRCLLLSVAAGGRI